MHLSTKTYALIPLLIITMLTVILAGCGGTPLNPAPVINIISVNGATVPIPTSSATAAVGTATFTVNVTGPSIVIDSDTYTETNMRTGVVTTFPVVPFITTIVPPPGGTGSGVWMMAYTYTNSLTAGGVRVTPAGTWLAAQHIYSYHTTPGNVTGTFRVVYQVVYN